MSGLGHTTPIQGTPAESRRPSLDGRVVAGKYELVRLLGEGGMGAVYEARHTTTLKRCAVKLLITPELAAHPEVVKRFFREARASGIAESDHIVQVYDSGTDPADSLPYMVMELLSGQDLEGLLNTAGAVEPNAACKLVLQAATGLAKAHERGIVHRDIKPANLFLAQREDGEITVKLLDFGIAKVKMENFADTSQGLTKSGSMLGTPLYMSPEQARGKKDVDARTDVWSLGIVLYVLLSGALPYNAETLGDLLVAIITSDIPLLQDRAPWVAPEVAEIVHRAIHRDPERRFATAGELRDALAQVVTGGSRIHASELTSVSGVSRAHVAPRLALSEDGLLRAGTRSGMSVTQESPLAVERKSRVPIIAVAAACAILLMGAGGVALKVAAKKRQQRAAGTATSEPVAVLHDRGGRGAATPAVAVVRHELSITPDTAEVTVDGKSVQVTGGKLEITGTLGETRTVKVTAGGRTKEQVVAIAQNGLVPDRVEVVVPKPEPPPGKGTKADSNAPAKAQPKAEPKATTQPQPTSDKPKPKVDTSQDEFKK